MFAPVHRSRTGRKRCAAGTRAKGEIVKIGLAGLVAVATAAAAVGLAPAAAADSDPMYRVSVGIALSPVSQQSAVRKAKDYLDYTAFSRSGLIKQLASFEGFSTADATFAVDSLTVDWNEQAAKKAKDYLDYTAFSRSGLIKQLVSFEGFTPEQAQYGVATTGL
jgi:hypothetical protein